MSKRKIKRKVHICHVCESVRQEALAQMDEDTRKQADTGPREHDKLLLVTVPKTGKKICPYCIMAYMKLRANMSPENAKNND